MKRPVYLDHQATTPLDPRVLDAMQPALTEMFGNAASRDHAYGWQAEAAVELAREQVAALIGAEPVEVVFTSGATESNNLAIKGVCEAYRDSGEHVVTVSTEHQAVLDPCRVLRRRGARVTELPVEPDGLLRPAAVDAAIDDRTVLLSVMLANNEIGTVQPLAAIGDIAHRRGVLLHSDAAQAVGKIPIDVGSMQIDLMSISAHKLYGPKGVGALYVRRRDPRVRLAPLIDGGGHERGLRSGTLNVPGIVGLGVACRLAAEEMAGEASRVRDLRDRLLGGIRDGLNGVHVHGDLVDGLPGSLSVGFDGIDGAALLVALREVAVSTGAACASAEPGPSHVLRAIGVAEPLARATIRIGIGRFNTIEEIDFATGRIVDGVRRLRGES